MFFSRKFLSLVKSFEIYFKPKIFRIWFFGIASGLTLLLSGNTLNFWIAKEGIDKITIGLFSLVAMPYIFKFLWAPLIDQIKIPYLSKILGQRKSWIFISQISIIIFVILLSFTDPKSQLIYTSIFSFLLALSSVCQDIALDALRVENLQNDNKAAGSAMYIFGYRIGMLISGGGAIYLSSFISWQKIYLLMAILIFILMIIILSSLKEENNFKLYNSSRSDIKYQNLIEKLKLFLTKPFQNYLKPKELFLILIFIILYRIADNIIATMANPFYLSLGFSSVEIAKANKFFGVFSAIIGGMISGLIIPRLNINKSLLIFGGIHLMGHFMFIIQNIIGYNTMFLYLTVGVEQITGGMTMTAYIAFITDKCYGKYSGTQYSIFSSMMGISRVIIPSISGWLVYYLDWNGFFIVTILLGIPALFLINIIKTKAIEKH